MSIRDYKITDAQFSEKGVIAAPDTLKGTAAENKSVFDRFAREIIAPQFDAIVDGFADMEDSANNWSAEEAQRVQQENARQTAEQGRADAEGQRATNETARLSAEENRIRAENDRVNAENKRDSAEKSRVSAENARNVWQTYDAAKTYVPGNKVSFGGSSYVCTAATVGHEPTDTAYWLLIAQKGADGAGADDLRRINDALDAVDPTKITTKVEPADGDGVMIADSADGGKAKRLLWSNVKAALGKLFVPLARKINGKALSADVTLTAADIKMPDSEEDVGAAMAKRLKDCGELSGQNDADLLTEPGFYRGGETSKMLLHAPIFSYAWTLEVLANSAWNVGVTQRFIDYETRRMFIRSNHPLESGWVWNNWMEVAQCKTPDYHALSLADGIQSHGTAVYWKDQFNVVSIIFDYGSKKSGSFTPDDWELLATLPEGFRPFGDNWRMCDDSESGSAVATCRVSANGELRYRASAQSQHLSLFGHIYITYIAVN